MFDKKIKNVKAIQILDSRGNPTIKTYVSTRRYSASALVPSGLSTGKYESFELRDKFKAYHGMSVTKALDNVNSVIAPKIIGSDVTEQKKIDETMIAIDGTKNKSKLGANAILSVSLAVSRCSSLVLGIPLYKLFKGRNVLPVPFCNVINGGKHAGGGLQFQEFMIAPVKAKSFSEAAQIVSEIYYTLKQDIAKKYGNNAINVGDEGGFVPPLDNSSDAFELILKSVEENGYEDKVRLALDAAASQFYNKKTDKYEVEKNKKLNRYELADYYLNIAKKYKLFSIEDPFDQEDIEGFKELTSKLNIQIVGDDLTATNIERISLSIKEKLCNCLLLKFNQTGTLTETLNAAKIASDSGWNVMVSHRSGDTEDGFISDLSVGLGCGQIKIGAPSRGERTAKFNRLLEIESELGNKAVYGK